jgi:sugar phosphate isomerase/epimerase
MAPFTLSAFGDEIDMNLDIQMEVLQKHGIRHIEMRGVDQKNVAELTRKEARVIRERLEKKGFGVSALGSPIGKTSITDEFRPQLEIFKNLLEIADVLQTRYIRIFSFYYPRGDDPAVYTEETLSRIRTMTRLAEEKGIILLHENEKDIYGDHAKRCLEILEEINSPNLKAIFDPANFIQCDVEPYPYAYNLLKDHIAYIHVKDALLSNKRVMPAGMGDGRIRETLIDLKNSGFDGFLSIEPHLGYFEGMEKLENNLDISKIKKGGQDAFGIAAHAIKSLLDGI